MKLTQADKEDRRRARDEVKKHGREIVKGYDLAKLLFTYDDDEAHKLLDRMRDEFWGSDLPNAVERGES